METAKFDVTAKPDLVGKPSTAQLKTMLQKLVGDRSQIAFHKEKKELAVYAIAVLKTGAKLTKNETDPGGSPTFEVGLDRLGFRNATIADAASVLQAVVLDQPVVDQTGLGAARSDFQVKFTRDPSQLPPGTTPAAANPDAPPDIFTAFQQQLGLKLASTGAPVDVGGIGVFPAQGLGGLLVEPDVTRDLALQVRD